MSTAINTLEQRLYMASMEVAGGLSLRRASYIYNVKKDTLRRYRLKGGLKPVGRPPSLGFDLEHEMETFLLTCAEIGWPLTIDNLRKMAYCLAETLPSMPFPTDKNRKAGTKWTQGKNNNCY